MGQADIKRVPDSVRKALKMSRNIRTDSVREICGQSNRPIWNLNIEALKSIKQPLNLRVDFWSLCREEEAKCFPATCVQLDLSALCNTKRSNRRVHDDACAFCIFTCCQFVRRKITLPRPLLVLAPVQTFVDMTVVFFLPFLPQLRRNGGLKK